MSFDVQDSPTTPGQPSLVSTEISGVEADKLLEAMEKYIRAGKGVNSKASEHSVADQDGGVLVKTLFKIPEMFGGGEVCTYNWYKFDAASLTVQIDHYPTDFFFKRKEALTTSWIKLLPGPIIEFWVDAHEVRSSGLVMERMLNKVLESLGCPRSAKCDQPAIGAEGQFSVVSEPIESATVTAENYLDCFKKFLVDEMGATDLPDGTVIEERSSVLGDLIGGASFAKHEFKAEEGHLYCHEFGEDESMQAEIGVTHVQVHKAPFKVEQWNVQKKQRLTGNAQKKSIEEYVKNVLTYMQEG